MSALDALNTAIADIKNKQQALDATVTGAVSEIQNLATQIANANAAGDTAGIAAAVSALQSVAAGLDADNTNLSAAVAAANPVPVGDVSQDAAS